MNQLSYLPASLINSNDTPAITGISTRRSNNCNGFESTLINIKNKILISITISKKLVPQRLWSFELLRTFSTFNSMPCSMQFMHLCSAPWYIKVLFISGVIEIIAIYPINITRRIIPSNNAIIICDCVILWNIPDKKYGSAKNNPRAITIERATVPPINRSSCFFSFLSNAFICSAERLSLFCFFSFSSSSSSKNEAEYISVLIPRYSESTKLTTPLKTGIFCITSHGFDILCCDILTSILWSGFLTATAYLF